MVIQVRVSGLKEARFYIRHLARKVLNSMDKSMNKLSDEIIQQAKSNINSRVRWENSGRLVGSFTKQKVRNGVTITNYAPYAAYVEEGTSPHLIRNKLGHTWRGPDYGKPHSATGGYYTHPGTRPMNFMRDAVDSVANRMMRMINSRLDVALKR